MGGMPHADKMDDEEDIDEMDDEAEEDLPEEDQSA